MSSFTRKMLPIVALAAMLSAPLAQAQSPAGAEQVVPGDQPGMM